MNNFLTNFFYRLAYIDQKNNLFLVKELLGIVKTFLYHFVSDLFLYCVNFVKK